MIGGRRRRLAAITLTVGEICICTSRGLRLRHCGGNVLGNGGGIESDGFHNEDGRKIGGGDGA